MKYYKLLLSNGYRQLLLRMMMFFGVVFSFVCIPFGGAIAATVTSVSGVIVDGGTITVNGLGFGDIGPSVVVFDDFEGGTAGAAIKTGVGSATVGKWDDRAGSSFYGTSAFLSGGQSFTSDYASGWTNYIQANLPPNTRNVFISWWIFVPLGNNFPGEGTTDGDNWKQMWVQGSSTTDDDLVVPTRLSSWVINGNEQDPGYVNWTTVKMLKGDWKRLWVWLKGSTSSSSGDGEVKFWELTSTGVVQRENDLSANNLKATGVWEKVRPNGYGRATPNCKVSFDDIYIAAGANAQARLEIGNASTYEGSIKLTMLTPSSWGDSKISARVHLGLFVPGEQAYLYVIDGAGNVSKGYSIAIGEGSTDTVVTPTAPGNFKEGF